MSKITYLAVSHTDDLEKVKDKNCIVLVQSTNSFYVNYHNKWVYVAPYCEKDKKKEKPVEQKIKNCINCGAPLVGHTCEYCGTRQ